MSLGTENVTIAVLGSQMALDVGSQIAHYEVTALIGEGGPATVRTGHRELRRGLAEANLRTRPS